MNEFTPLLFVGAFVGLISAVLIFLCFLVKEEKEPHFDRRMKDGELFCRLMKYAKPYRFTFVAIFVLLIGSVTYDVLSPYLIGVMEKMLISEGFVLTDLWKKLALYVSILLVSVGSTYGQAVLLQKTGQGIVSALRMDLFAHVESLSHQQLSRIPVGKLVTRVANDTDAISNLFTKVLSGLMKDIFMLVGIFGAMLVLNYQLALTVACFFPFVVLFSAVFRRFSRMAYRKVKDGTTDINTYLSEHLSGMKLIQVFGREDFKEKQFLEKNARLTAAKHKQILVYSVFRPLIYLLFMSSVLMLFWLSGRGYLNSLSFLGQTIDSATLVSFYLYISSFFDPIQRMAEQFNWLQSAFASAEKIFTLFDEKPDVVDLPDAEDLTGCKGNIEFSHVWFAYEDENWVLKDVSFKVNAGETVAFVGATGSGKTTILSLLCRNYDIQKGQILVDGVDIRHYTIASLRRQFGQMLQDVFLFSGTVRSNLLLHEERSEDAILTACKAVNADSVIARLPKGLDEEVKERGANFSAGERQLLSFARTVLHKPSVMILDEATANIDTETERLIQDSLEKMMKMGTLLIVAHRLSTVQNADKIFYLSHGEIVEEGNQQELLALHGRYYELYRLQEE